MTIVVIDSRQHDVSSEAGLLSFYDDVFDEVYRSAARLVWGDRGAAEDLVQEAFIRLVRSVQAGAVTTVGIGWMVTTIRRIHIDGLRSHDREERRLRLVTTTATSVSPAEDGAITSLLDGLSDRERTALILRYVEDLSVADVADVMGTSVRATESLLQRAKRRVRKTGSAS